VPASFKQPTLTHLAHAPVTNLVNALRHSDVWHRDSAERVLYERQDKAAIVPLIQLLFDSRAPGLGRVYSLHALDGLGTLVPGHIMRALSDPDERVRQQGIFLAEKLLANTTSNFSDTVWGGLTALTGDPSPQVRYQLAFTLGQCRNSGRVQALTDIIRSDPGSRWMQTAVLSSLNEGSEEMLGLLSGDGAIQNNASGRNFLEQLALMTGLKNHPEETARALTAVAAVPEAELGFLLARRLQDGLLLSAGSFSADDTSILRPVYASAKRYAADANAAEGPRVQAIRLLDATGAWDPQLAAVISPEWGFMNTRLRSEVAIALCNRPERTAQTILQIESLFIPAPTVPPFQVRVLLNYPNADIRQQAKLLYGNPAVPSRQNMVDQFSASLRMGGSSERGGVIFTARCGDCHRAGGIGDPLGLPLMNNDNTSREALLAKIIDPNRDLPTNSAVLIVAKGNDTLSGNVISRKASSYTICQPNGEFRVLPQSSVVSETPLGISAMPEKLESGLSQQDMADLLEFLAPGSLPPQ
jgi:putative heme-binding domain-containing protein